MKNSFKFLPVFLALALLFPVVALARIGVGVGTGKIQVDERLNPGTIYELPVLTILNTGDESSDYEVMIQYHQDQPEFEPEKDWFEFTPREFKLEPGEVQQVKIKLNLPVKAKPGDYFAYLEGRPAQKSESGQIRIGVAAATKLNFTVKSANLFTGIYYKALSFWKVYAPWPTVASGLVVIIILALWIKKNLKVDIKVKKKEEKKEVEKD